MKKGFTLIELLAVIVILSVITLITVPMVMNVIEDSKKKALASSVEGLVESANLYAIENDGVYEFLFDKEHQGSTIKGEKLEYKGNIDGEGKLYLDKEGNVSVCISNDNYYVYKNYNSGIIVGDKKTGNCIIGFDALTNKYVAMLDNGTGNVSNVYSKDEVNNLVDNLDTKITNNANEITNMKSNIEELQNILNNYALQSELDKTNSNLNNLSSLVNNNTESINGFDGKLKNKANMSEKLSPSTSYSFDIGHVDEFMGIMQLQRGHVNPDYALYEVHIFNQTVYFNKISGSDFIASMKYSKETGQINITTSNSWLRIKIYY
ncbi:MAG: type II secretion system GspH family protein [Tenericutes bacterium]|nr:type II secretion system GspH family protein [Mycoplasmatota bacterium]